ncbi:MAG: aldolase/citrate lyase family protein [Polaromonas sp.]
MIDLLTITNLPQLAARCDQMPGMRLFVDLERNGKAARQKGHDTFISTHHLDDVGRIKAVLTQSRLMVRVNPYQTDNPTASQAEVDAAIGQGADMLMLPMFSCAEELRAFANVVAGRVPIVPLLETAGALHTLESWIDTPGLNEIFVGLNDLHLSLGCSFMFEPLLMGHVERVALAAKARGLRFGFGGIARMDEGALPGRDVLAEHVRLGSGAVILSRTFNRLDVHAGEKTFEQAVAELRAAELALCLRNFVRVDKDMQHTHCLIAELAEAARAPA